MSNVFIAYFLFLLCVVLLGIPVFLSFARRWGILLDTPGARSSHVKDTVSGAGVFIVWSALLTWILLNIFMPCYFLNGLIASAFFVALVSFIDDIRGASIIVRLAVHCLAALFFVIHVPAPDFLNEWLGSFAFVWYPCAVIFIAGVTNLYNFMDGIDGITAAHTVVLLICWGLLNSIAGTGTFEWILCLSLIIPLIGFLVYNWHPARIFMGDTGSTFIGFTLACLAIVQVPGMQRSNNFFAIMMLMMPFLFDAVFTLATRFLRREKWYLPHRKHLFQRLVDSGISQATVASVYGLITLYIGIVLVFIEKGILERYLSGIVLFIVPYALLYLWVIRSQGSDDAISTYSIPDPAHL